MDTDFSPPLTLDLTGLPAPVVRHLVQIVEAARAGASPPAELPPGYISRPELTPAEFRQALERMGSMSTGQSLPLDFSSADIYDDHD